jgi:hypothetical protein
MQAEDLMLPCAFRSATGIECPGCGSQRAMLMLLQGDIAGSVAMFPALIPALFTVVYVLLHLRFGFRGGHRRIVAMAGFSVALMIVNYVGRLLLSQ